MEEAAIATILSQSLALIWILRILCDKREFLHFSRSSFGVDWRIARRSLSIGLAPCLMNVASCFVVIFINNQFKNYGGDLAIGAFGIGNRVVFIFLMIVMGFTQGMQPIAGYNYGARQYDRVMKAFNLTVICSCIVTSVCFIVGEFFPRQAASIFTKDPQLIEMAAHGMQINVIMFLIIGRQMVISYFFQSLGLARKAIFLSLTRQLLFLLPFLILLPRYFGTDGVWYSMPASDLAALVVSELMLHSLQRQFKKEQQKESV